MKTVFLFVVLVSQLIGLAGCSSSSFELSNGQKKLLSDFKGEWLLINYWAVWCKPCIKEIPGLNALDQQSDVSVLGYNFDNSQGDSLAQQVEVLGIKFPSLSQDPAELFGQTPPKALPATMLVNPQSQLVTWLYGPQTQGGIDKIIRGKE